jgi:hypothetical protein
LLVNFPCLQTDPASNEVMCLADKLRRPTAAPDVQRHGGGHSNQSDSLDLLPFIPDPDGKVGPSCFKLIFNFQSPAGLGWPDPLPCLITGVLLSL